jgi:hypothetical protein
MLLTGCVTGKETYTILDLKTRKSVTLKKQSMYPEEIISVNDQTKTFRIFTRSKEGGFEIWDVHYDGSLAQKIRGGDFSAYILHWYGLSPELYGVSDNGDRIAYFDLPGKELRLFNIKDSSERVLLTNVASNEVSIVGLKWYSQNELIIAISGRSGDKARILMLNVDSKSIMFELDPCELIPSAPPIFSHNKRYLIYGDDCKASPKGSYRIYNIQTRREVGVIIGQRGIYANVCWSEGDDKFVYADGGDIMEYSMSSKNSRCLKSYPKEIAIHILGYERGQVFYGVGTGADKAPLHIYDVATGTERMIKNISLNGRMIISPGGEFIITGWGF